MERISRIAMYFEIVEANAKRSLCMRNKVGAILVRDNRVVAMGYNGTLPNVDPSVGLNKDGSSNTVHAEANLIAYCAKHGIPTNGCSLYISISPCNKCAELIVQAGIDEVIYKEEYRITTGIEILINQEVSCHQYTK